MFNHAYLIEAVLNADITQRKPQKDVTGLLIYWVMEEEAKQQVLGLIAQHRPVDYHFELTKVIFLSPLPLIEYIHY